MASIRKIPKAALLAHSTRLMWRLAAEAPRRTSAFRQRRKAAQRLVRKDGRRTRVIFYYSQVVWQEVWQRPQEVALGLADYAPVVYMSPVQVHRLYDSVRDWQEDFRVERGHGVRVVQPLILPGEYKTRSVFRLNQRLVWSSICSVLPPEAELIFISNSPFSADLIDRLDWSRRAYDAIDDFPGFSWAPPWARSMEDRWLERADVVFSGTSALAEKHAHVRSDIEFIPCGVRFDLFHDVESEIPAELRDLPRPILGYIGTVSDRLDRQLLEKLAGEFSEGSIVMIGPVHGSFDAPRGLDNFHLLGPRPHETLPAFVQQFDLALMPFEINEATEAINPVKTLEYLAAGRPVISTAIPDVVRHFSDEVVIARDREAFVRAAREQLSAESDERRRLGIERARRLSWDETVRRVAERLGLKPDREES